MNMFHRTRWFYWEPRDMWIGLYWKRYPAAIDIYVCIVPCFPINVYLQWNP